MGNKHTPKIKDPRFDWRTIFLKNSGGLSSKRIIAAIGVTICFSLLIASFLTEKDIPEFADIVFIGCLSLYGVEAIPNWTKSITKG